MGKHIFPSFFCLGNRDFCWSLFRWILHVYDDLGGHPGGWIVGLHCGLAHRDSGAMDMEVDEDHRPELYVVHLLSWFWYVLFKKNMRLSLICQDYFYKL